MSFKVIKAVKRGYAFSRAAKVTLTDKPLSDGSTVLRDAGPVRFAPYPPADMFTSPSGAGPTPVTLVR